MACAFQVHNEIGRFFDEKIYKRLVARRFGGIQLEVPVIVSCNGFEKRYALDMLVRGAALFEWKAVDKFAQEHRAQLLHYLMLCDLPKGKLANVRPELIEHEFVNTTLRPEDRQKFSVDDTQFVPLNEQDVDWKEFLLEALRDWGAGLDVHLYETAISHIFGGEERVIREIDIVADARRVGVQRARLTSSNATFKVTALSEHMTGFERHARRFVAHTTLDAVHWVNITRQKILFKTLLRQEDRGQEDTDVCCETRPEDHSDVTGNSQCANHHT
jgi:GxxExxY protein